MRKRYQILLLGAGALALVCALALAVVRRLAPPGEEWIAWHNDELTASIDRQLEGVDVRQILADKEGLVVEKSVAELQAAVARGDLTYEQIAVVCLHRIKTMDQNRHGYNSVMEIAPDGLSQARACDLARREGRDTKTPLYGIPVLIKDNINTADMPTSAGAVAFAEFVPSEDAELVSILRGQGAVVLGKNNLSEFAYYVSGTMPSGYSGKKGQTVNPFGPLKISPSGSSSGSAVAVTANLAPVSIGTETAGSIVGPASANSVVGFKPTRGAVPAGGIFPLIKKVDTAGPITKNVEDAALVYAALSGQEVPELNSSALRGSAVGLISHDYEDQRALQRLREALERAGARVVEIEPDTSGIQVQNIIHLTFRRDFAEFAGRYDLPIRDLGELTAFNQADPGRRARYGQDLLLEAAAVQTADDSQIDASIQRAQRALDGVMEQHGLDAVVFLGASSSAAVAAAGGPELCIPFGADKKGAPQGVTFAAGRGMDAAVLNLGYSFEQTVRGRMTP